MANLPIGMSSDRPCSGQFNTALGSQAFNGAFQTVRLHGSSWCLVVDK